MADTKIQWTNKTWNPIRARRIADDQRGWYWEHVSEGCRNCYAEKMNVNTYFGNGLEYKPSSLPQLELFLDEKILQQPLQWRKPQNVFPCSMTDLFGRWVKDEWIDAIFAVMAQAPQHTFQVLTKRPERMRDYMNQYVSGKRKIGSALGDNDSMGARLVVAQYGFGIDISKNQQNEPPYSPPQHVWLGVSVEDQKTADERIPILLETEAAIHWVSAEPLLAPLSLCGIGGCCGWRDNDLQWIVIGGESGTNARPFHIEWATSIIEQVRLADVPVTSFVKQLGANPFIDGMPLVLKDKKGGDIAEFPEWLQVREYPLAATQAAASVSAH